MPESTKTYEIEFSDGRVQRLTVPASYKVTFGAIVPSDKAATYSGTGGWGLRFYEGSAAGGQRAVFTEVKRFRDLSLPMEVRAVRKFGSEDWWQDDGTWTGKRADLVEKAWMDANVIVEMPHEEATHTEPTEDIDLSWAAKRALRSR